MRKTILFIALAIITISLNSQDLASIVKKYEKATGADKLNSYKTIVMEGSINMQGMQMLMTIKEKRPDMLKTVMEVSGMEMLTVINGDKGYMISPMMGSTEPTPLPSDQIAQAKNNRNLGSNLSEMFKDNKLELLGKESFRGTPAFKVKMNTEAGDVFMFISEETSLIKGMQMEVSQGGVTTNVEAVMSNYKETDGVMMAMKIDSYVSGTYAYGVVFTKVEFNVPINDSEFAIK